MSPPQRRRAAHALVEFLAARVREAYIEEYEAWRVTLTGSRQPYRPNPKWEGGRRQRDGSRSESAWEKTAKFLLAHRVHNYRAYLHLQFQAARARAYPPAPNQLYSRTALALWEEYSRRSLDLRRELLNAYRLQSYIFRDHVRRQIGLAEQCGRRLSKREALINVLCDETLELTALFRCCLALREGLDFIYDKYRDAAMAQYSLGPEAYDEVWDGLIPQEFRETVEACLASLRRGSHA